MEVGVNGEEIFSVGSAERLSVDGCKSSSAFIQPLGICAEDQSLFLADSVCGKIKVISPVDGTLAFLQNISTIYSSFGIHMKGVDKKHPSMDEACQSLSNLSNLIS